MRAATSDVDIAEFLASEGFTSADALARARDALEHAGLTRPGKRRLSSTKLARAQSILRTRFVRVCHRNTCRDVANPREHLVVPSAACEICRGSSNRRAGTLAREALLAQGRLHLLVVGGTPASHAALQASLAADGLEIRCIDGKQGSISQVTAEADLAWANVLLIWATTPLPHKVSRLYTARTPGDLPKITVPRRSVEALCDELLRFTRT